MKERVQRFQHLNAKISSLALRPAKHAVTGLLSSGAKCVWEFVCTLGFAIVFLRFVWCGVPSSATTCTSGIQSMSGPLPRDKMRSVGEIVAFA